jgi:transposase
MRKFINNIKVLEERIERIEEENNKLRELVEILRRENEGLKLENIKLKRENGELKEKLGLNSKDSHLPSSKDLYKIKKESRKSERNIGGQAGHKGVTRDRMVADEIIKIELGDQCECGGIIAKSAKPYIHQKVDIPEIKPYVVEYQVEHGRCKRCGKRVSSDLPEGISRDTFGPKVKTIISALGGFYKNSKREIANILRDVFNLDISVGSISNSEERVIEKCETAYNGIMSEVKKSEVLHIDETSHYNKGKLGWCWMFTSSIGSFIQLTNSRGKKVLDSFAHDQNIIVTDRYAAYNHFARKNRQICWAHLVREFERFRVSYIGSVSVIGYYLKLVANELFKLKDSVLKNEINIFVFLRRAKKLRKRTLHYLKQVANVANVCQASRIAKTILKSFDMMWRFLDDPINIPLTNNHAERQIRHYVVYRKNSYFTWSERGNRFLERIISTYLTWKQKGQNPFQNLFKLVSS